MYTVYREYRTIFKSNHCLNWMRACTCACVSMCMCGVSVKESEDTIIPIFLIWPLSDYMHLFRSAIHCLPDIDYFYNGGFSTSDADGEHQ